MTREVKGKRRQPTGTRRATDRDAKGHMERQDHMERQEEDEYNFTMDTPLSSIEGVGSKTLEVFNTAGLQQTQLPPVPFWISSVVIAEGGIPAQAATIVQACWCGFQVRYDPHVKGCGRGGMGMAG